MRTEDEIKRKLIFFLSHSGGYDPILWAKIEGVRIALQWALGERDAI